MSHDNTERTGINAIEAAFLAFGWTFREQPISDYGIDAQVEIREKGEFQGLFALQIKSGPSHFKRKRDSGIVFRDSQKHLKYWLKLPVPVFLILYNTVDKTAIWQKIEKRLTIDCGDDFEILVPESNVLNEGSKFFFSQGIPADEEAIRRFNLAFDMPTMRLFRENAGKLIFFAINDWINKSLNIRDVEVFFDDHGKDKPDLRIHIWTPAQSFHAFMNMHFPWLEYDHAETVEALDNEVEVHILEVRLNQLAESYIAVEDYIENGPTEPDESEAEADGDGDEW